MCTELSICSVCIQHDYNLINVNETDKENVKWSCKLKFCVPEVEWDVNSAICSKCTLQLDTFSSFRNLCLQSNGFYNKIASHKNEESCDCCLCANKQKIDYKCYECNRIFFSKLAITTHMSTHLSYAKIKTETQLHYKCEFCSRSFKSSSLRCNHVAESHVEQTTSAVEEKDFDFEDSFNNKPIATLNSKCKRSFTCETCKQTFISSKKLIAHSINVHNFHPTQIKPFQCSKCDSKFATSSNLLQHEKYHIGKRTHICTFCGKGYITKSDLNTHEKQHFNKREYQCNICPKTFNTNKDLRSHRLVVHTDSTLWNYICTFCSKRFPIKSNLDQHIRRHTGDKRFGCHICDKRFVDKIVLQKHIKSHSNFRAFKCQHCNKEYKEQQVLEIHLTKAHGIGNAKIPIREKKYFCHICPQSYFAKNKLTRHVFSHTGEKPYNCYICNRRFTDKSYVKQHLKTSHNIIETNADK